MADVVLDHIDKVYENGFQAVTDLNLQVNDGEFLVLVGPSGCGKSTALRMIAGLEDISAGELRIGGERMNEAASRDRDIAMVFQSYALYPHMSVYENIAFGLRLRKMDKAEIDDRVRKAGRMLGLEDLLERRPKLLSGGQRQRVAMGRAIVRQPRVFLMDEPLSNLDAKLRVQMRAEIAKLQRDMAVTTIYVTHDQVEAMTMADRVAVMRKGILQQVATPQELYDHPSNLFVAGFMGSPPMNMAEGVVDVVGDDVGIKIGGQRLQVDPVNAAKYAGLRDAHGRTIIVGARPEDLRDTVEHADWPAERRLKITVDMIELMGSENVVHFAVDSKPVFTDEQRGGDDAVAAMSPKAIWVAKFGARAFVRLGDSVDVAVDTLHLHFFDPETGLALR